MNIYDNKFLKLIKNKLKDIINERNEGKEILESILRDIRNKKIQ